MRQWNSRKRMVCFFVLSIIFLGAVTVAGYLFREKALVIDFSRKNLPPCFSYPFGTDWLGRDMFARTMTGLSMSIRIGLLAAAVSACLAFLLGVMGAVMGKIADGFVTGLIDLVMGIPHILLLVLISFALGKGFKGVVIGISLTHWTSLARLIRGEVLQLKESQYIKIAQKLGQGKVNIAVKHMMPHLMPQLLVGLVLLFPHAILHEAGITFLGFGLSPEQPAVGIILSESMKYLAMGSWWLALFPGLFLAAVVLLFHLTGDILGRLMDPGRIHQ
ncbi:MAG: ABC transporter permease [Lacrimispora sp.]|uniref:ABC transporter permease n=1 Tax=Lacrimispora sp. TaxID=2719234 RepID=UPI0039E647B9